MWHFVSIPPNAAAAATLERSRSEKWIIFLHLLLARCFSSLFFCFSFSPLTLGRKWRGRWRIWWRTWCLPNPFQFDVCVFFPLLFFFRKCTWGSSVKLKGVSLCRFPTALYPSAPFLYFPAPFPRRRSGDFRSCLGIPFLRNSRPFLLGKGAQQHKGKGLPLPLSRITLYLGQIRTQNSRRRKRALYRRMVRRYVQTLQTQKKNCRYILVWQRTNRKAESQTLARFSLINSFKCIAYCSRTLSTKSATQFFTLRILCT